MQRDAPATAAANTGALPHGARVLIVRLSALGDVLFALETVAALHRARPDVRIEFFVEDRFAALLQDHPQLAAVHVYPRRTKLRILPNLVAMRRRRFDAILDLHGILKSAVQVRCLRAARRIGLAAPGAREGSQRFYDVVVPVPEPLPHRAELGYLLLRALGVDAEPAAPVLPVAPPPPDLLSDLPRPRVLLHPGTSSFATFKRWPVERFAELARRLAAEPLGLCVSFGPGERELAAPVLAAAPSARAVDGQALGLRGLAGALQQCDVVVAADTGPLHIAAAVGARCVALFGPKEPRRYGPRAHGSRSHELLYHDVPCRPCTRRDCASPQCVLGLDVDRVEAAVRRQLEAAR
jgi:lipopolysaccharide heptosyltransferase I